MGETRERLTAKQERFVREYLVDLNGTQAAIRAGYSAKSARAIASELLTKPDIVARVQELNRKRQDRLELKAETVLGELLKLATVDVSDLYDAVSGKLKPLSEIPEAARKAIAGLEVEELFDGSGEDRGQIGVAKKLRLWDKVKALELLGKHLKLFSDRVEHEVKFTLEQLLEEANKAPTPAAAPKKDTEK